MTMSSMSRRAFLPLIAGVALSPVVLVPQSARAQGATWQMYRPEGLGFEIEMPGRPEIRQEREDGRRSIEAVVDVDQMQFGVGYRELEEAITVQQVATAQRLVARTLGGTITREAIITMNGFPGFDIVMESDALSMAMRLVVMNKRSISAMVTGQGGLSDNPSVRRFLDLLQAAAITGDRVMTILRSMSRRAFLPLDCRRRVVAGRARAAIGARARRSPGRCIVREGLGFEAEMPGEPKITIEQGERDDILVRSVDAVVDVDQISFSAQLPGIPGPGLRAKGSGRAAAVHGTSVRRRGSHARPLSR